MIFFNNESPEIDLPFDVPTFAQSVCRHLKVAIEHLELTFLTPNEMQSMNKKHLNHDYPTDTISFPLSSEPSLAGDIYICPKVVQENATAFTSSFEKELKIVIIHSILHLTGVTDDTASNFKNMKQLQDQIYSDLNL